MSLLRSGATSFIWAFMTCWTSFIIICKRERNIVNFSNNQNKVWIYSDIICLPKLSHVDIFSDIFTQICSNFYESDQSLVETEELLLLICQLFFCRLLLLPSEDLKVLSFDSIATMQKFKTWFFSWLCEQFK